VKKGESFEKAVALVEATLSETGGENFIKYVVDIMNIMYAMGFKAGKKSAEKETR